MVAENQIMLHPESQQAPPAADYDVLILLLLFLFPGVSSTTVD